MNVRILPLLLALSPFGAFAGRSAAQSVSPLISERAERRAACRDVEAQNAVRAGISWLVDHQDEKGFWDSDGFMKNDPGDQKCDGPGNPTYDIGMTGVALLALLAQADPIRNDPARRAADWLVSQLHRKSGRFHCDAQDFIYSQAVATLALVEAAALFGGDKYREGAADALRYLEAHRNPGKAWRYQPRDGSNDTSVAAWCTAAYATATHVGMDVPARPIGEALAWLDGVTVVETGHCGYSNRGEASARSLGDHSTRFPVEKGEAMTAAGMHMRAIAGLFPGSRLNRAAAKILSRKLPAWVADRIDFYYWFQGSEAMAALPGADQKKWFAALHRALLPHQRKDGAFLGSWDPVGVWGQHGGRVYSTALGVLALSSPYRLALEEVETTMPDAPPFRRVYYHWKKGEIGAAITALDVAAAGELTAEQRLIERRIRWFATVQVHFCDRVVGGAAQLHPELVDRHTRLEELATIYAGTPAAEAAERAVELLLENPAFRTEVEAAKMLRAVLKRFDVDAPPRSSSKRRALVKRFRKVVEKHPGSTAAKTAQDWIRRLGG